MSQGPEKKNPAFSVIKWLGLFVIGLFLAYVIVGFWVVPPLLKPKLENELSRQIGRNVSIGDIRLNPLALSSTINKLIVYEINGEPFAGFEELFIDAQLSSLVKWAVTLKEIRLLAPFGGLKLLPDKKLNIDDILTKFSQPKQTDDTKTGLFPAIISKLQIEDGKITVEDNTSAEPIKETFSPITFTLENLSTLKERQGVYKFVGVGSSGGQYHLEGKVSVNPVRVQGSYSTTGNNLGQIWQHIKDQVSFQITDGTLGASGNYSLEFTDGTLNAELQNGDFELKDFQLTEKGDDTLLISVPSLAVKGVDADLKSQEIMIDRVNSADARILSWLEPDGTFKLQSLLLPDLQKLSENEKSEPREPDAVQSRPWYVTVNKVELTGWGASIEDRTLPKPAQFSFNDITLTIDKLSNKKNAQPDATLALRINQAGTVRMNGSAGIDPLMADLSVVLDKIALKSFQAYLDTAVNAQIDSGTISSKGRILYQGNAGTPQIRFKGELSLDGLGLNDRLKPQDFVTLEQFKTSGIELDLLPNRLQSAEVLMNKPYARVTIDQNGTVNVVQTFSPVKKGDQNGKENLLQRLAGILIAQFKGPMPLKVDLVQLNNFSADFVDGSIAPNYTTRLDISKGTVKGLSSEPSAQADFKIEGTIDQSATIESAGQMNPLNALQYTQVDFALNDFDLKPVSPYSGKYVGYKIDQGKLQLKLTYLVDKDAIDGKNRIVIDQLTLGEKVDNPNATNLPVALGVALLRGADGRITLEVPVAGSIKNPQFNIGNAIKDSITKTIHDAGSSPFSTISEVDGFKGEELRFVEFESGLSELNPRSIKKLNAVAKFLNEKTALKLGIQGTADRQRDWARISGKQTNKVGPPSTDKTLNKDGMAGSAEEQVIDDKQLEQLARIRANQVKAYLTQQSKVSAKRIQLKSAKITDSTKGDFGLAELSLSAR
jgi:outer membrane protein OmpA-like peptidoglycan-associated protein